jgi:MFS family permease
MTASGTASRFRRIGVVASRPPYSHFLIGQGLDQIGIWINRTTIGWLVWDLTQSPAWLGAAAFLSLAPTIFLGPVGGVLADNMPKQRLLGGAKSISVIAMLVIAALVALNIRSPLAVLAVVTTVGCAFALTQASGKTIISELVERADLSPAVALNSIVINLATFVGPGLAGLLILGFGIAAALSVSACLTLIYVVIVVRLPLPGKIRVKRSKFWSATHDGFTFVLREPGMAPLFALHAAFSIVARPFMDMAPGIASTFFALGPGGLAAITSTVGAGAVIGGIWLAQRGGAGLGAVILGASLVLDLSLLAFLVAPGLVIALPIAAIFGAAMVVRAAGIQTMLQLGTEEAFRGRVLGFYLLVLHGGGALGGLAIGFVAEDVGIRSALGVTALIALLLWSWIAVTRYRSIAALERQDRNAAT